MPHFQIAQKVGLPSVTTVVTGASTGRGVVVWKVYTGLVGLYADTAVKQVRYSHWVFRFSACFWLLL